MLSQLSGSAAVSISRGLIGPSTPLFLHRSTRFFETTTMPAVEQHLTLSTAKARAVHQSGRGIQTGQKKNRGRGRVACSRSRPALTPSKTPAPAMGTGTSNFDGGRTSARLRSELLHVKCPTPQPRSRPTFCRGGGSGKQHTPKHPPQQPCPLPPAPQGRPSPRGRKLPSLVQNRLRRRNNPLPSLPSLLNCQQRCRGVHTRWLTRDFPLLEQRQKAHARIAVHSRGCAPNQRTR